MEINIEKVIEELEFDLTTGIYDLFPELKKKLYHILTKLQKARLVINYELRLTYNEQTILKENEYI